MDDVQRRGRAVDRKLQAVDRLSEVDAQAILQLEDGDAIAAS